MNCPVCKEALVRDKYEGSSVYRCPQCDGFLVEPERLEFIVTRHELKTDELEEQLETQSAQDVDEPIRCPRCVARKMQKQMIHRDSEDSFKIDQCEECHIIWLDGGEIARLQLRFEEIQEFLKNRKNWL